METKSITVSDMQSVVQIIDVACSRGAFRGEEMLQIAQLREKIVEFVTNSRKNPENE